MGCITPKEITPPSDQQNVAQPQVETVPETDKADIVQPNESVNEVTGSGLSGDNEIEKTATATIFLVKLGDEGKTGKETGCGDSVVPYEVRIKPTQTMLQASLESLFAIKDNVPKNYHNSVSLSDLKVDSINITEGTATIEISGVYALGGDCDGPRFVDQIKETILNFKNIKKAIITIDGRSLESFGSLKE